MGIFKGGALRLFQSFLYTLAFLCSAIILGIYSYFLSVQADRHAYISKQSRAVEGISGAACLYTICALLLTCCLGGVTFFAFLGLVLDILFVGGMIAIAVLTRNGSHSCRGNVNTPIGNGPANSKNGFNHGHDITYAVKLGTACRLNTAVFAVAIIAAFLFLITALLQIALSRSHKKEKRFGPSPSNNYTSGYGKKKGGLFARKNKKSKTHDAELGAAGAGVAAGGLAAGHHHHHDNRTSHETGYTGTTVGNGVVGGAPYDKVEPNGTTGMTGTHNTHSGLSGLTGAHNTHNGVGGMTGTQNTHSGVGGLTGMHNTHNPLAGSGGAQNAHSGYYTQPQGTGVHPYGYENTATGGATGYNTTTGTATNY